MYAYLTIVRYPRWLGWAGFLSMAFFRIPFLLNKKATFYKLMGCGKNGSFDKVPDLRQWAVLMVASPPENLATNQPQDQHKKWYGSFVYGWWHFFGCRIWSLVLEPIEGHGKWDGKEVFGSLPRKSSYDGVIAVLTRATIKIGRLKNFWSHVAGVSKHMQSSQGFITSLGIGEVPWIKQATFSVWENKESMQTFSYRMKEHTEVIRKTREEKWYSEEMFVRFRIIASIGRLTDDNPLAGKL